MLDNIDPFHTELYWLNIIVFYSNFLVPLFGQWQFQPLPERNPHLKKGFEEQVFATLICTPPLI